jgi:hypothetical protein
MPVRLQTLLVFVFTYFLLSLFYDTSHYLPLIYLINCLAGSKPRRYFVPAFSKVRASYMIELSVSMKINNLFFSIIEVKKKAGAQSAMTKNCETHSSFEL